MDNVIQNIKIEDIILDKIHTTIEPQKIDELVEEINTFGLIDPILVKPKNDKYEIVLGQEKYLAALKSDLKRIPAIIKEEDNEVHFTYSNNGIKKHSSKFSNMQKELNKKTDIINLSELSKSKMEYERDDLKMNNEQLINNNIQPVVSTQTPAFGDKFYPSLEDEPTNMNMMGGIPTTTSSENNNLIDLTDLSSETETQASTTVNINAPLNPVMQSNNTQSIPNDISVQPSAPSIDNNIINLDSLQNNNPAVQPIESAPVTMEILNQDFGAPTQTGMNIAPEFYQTTNNTQPDLTLNQPTMISNPEPILQNPVVGNFGVPIQPEINSAPENLPPINNVQPDLSLNQTTVIPNPEPTLQNPVVEKFGAPIQSEVYQPLNIEQSGISINEPIIATPEPTAMPAMPPVGTEFNQSQDINSPIATPIVETPETQINPQPKDIVPVTSTIRSLASSLQTFGYKINITEEDLPTSAKIIIEIEK